MTREEQIKKLDAMAKPRSEEAIKKAEERKMQREEKDLLAKGFFRQCAISFMNYLDANNNNNKMCLSNMECEDIENAFMNADWAKLHRYHNKYIKDNGTD